MENLLVRLPSLPPVRRAQLWRLAAVASLGLGYLDLARGGLTVAPALLVIAYVVFVPAVLITW